MPARRTTYLSGPEAQGSPQLAEVDALLKQHVLAQRFPCVAARSAFNKGNYRFGLFDALDSQAATAALHAGICRFNDEFDATGAELVTYCAVFDGPHIIDEQAFEALLWQQLQALHLLDAKHHPWAPGVSSDSEHHEFSFSVGGRAFFIVGLHPQASRLARRAHRPMLVFNFHEQFEALRRTGKFESMKKVTRQRDLALQGSINPVLAQFGERSEARQYAGRHVPIGWKCPFHAVEGAGQ